jgi:hypothetical protein
MRPVVDSDVPAVRTAPHPPQCVRNNSVIKRLHMLPAPSLAACAVLLLIGSCTPHSRAAKNAAPSPTLVVTGATVVDLVSGAAVPSSIVVEAGRITLVGPPDQILAPPQAERIDVPGTFVIPDCGTCAPTRRTRTRGR